MSSLVAGVRCTAAVGTLSSRWSLAHPLLQHVGVCGLAVGICCLLAIPGALWLGRRQRGARTVAVLSLVGRVLPGLAVLAALSVLASWSGVHDVTVVTVVALVGCGLPPLWSATYRAVRGVDPGVREVCRGLGMSPRQEMARVDLPLAAPALLAGLRRCSVRVIGVATTAALIAGPGLGRLIVAGLAGHDDHEVLAGAGAVSALALVVDVALSGLARLAGRRVPREQLSR